MKNLRATSSGGLVVAILGLTLIATSVPLSATNGYLIHGIGTRAKAMAGAGVALPLDAMSAGTNPASVAWLGKRYDAGLGFFNPNREYTITGNPSGFPGTFGLAPGNVESDATLFFVPHFGGIWELTEHSAWGLALYGQGGMNTEWPTRTFGGSQPTGVDLSQLFIVPTYATKFGSDAHAIGISPILAVQLFEATGLQAFGGFSLNAASLTNNGHDTSTGFGAKVGYLGQLTDNFSIGLAYQTEISMEEFGDYAGLFAEGGGFDIPSNYVAGIAYKFGGNAVFALDYQEIFYTDVASVSNPFSSLLPPGFGGTGPVPLGAANGAGFGWQDMEVIKAGFEWGGDPWTWRLGFSTTDQPIPPSEVLFNILAPGVVEEHFTFGFTRSLGSGNKAFSMSLMHAPSVSVTGPNRLEFPGAQSITLEMDQWDLEIGYTWGI